jgi:hypothetical protein
MTTRQILTETFNSRATYLAWRADWKRAYAQISEDIRVLKLVSKDHTRNPVTGWDEKAKVWKRFRTWTDVEAKRQEKYAAIVQRSRDEHGNSSPTRKDLAAIATMLIARRHWGKEEAQRQYLEAKANPPLVSIC